MLDLELHGRKGGGDKPHTPVETPNNLLSVAYGKVLIAVAEGELAGRPTARDIYLDGTPLMNEDGSLNFGGVKWEWRSGTVDQEYIQGLPEVSTEYNVGVEIRDNQPWVRQVTTPNLDGVRVTFQWPALLKQESNGDTVGISMDYAIDLSVNGGAFNEYQRYNINGKTNTAYERTHRVDIPKDTNVFTIRARRITPDDQSGNVQDTINLKSYAEVIDVKQRYPNTALLYVEFDSRLFGGTAIPKVSVRTKGRIVRVPSNYDPETRTYNGIWAGDFKQAWTNNPAWIYYDIVTNDRFGLGHKVTSDMVDKFGLYEIAQYCDVMVSDGKGGLEPRHTCNIYIAQKSDAWKVLRSIADIFNGMTYWDGNKFVVVADKEEPTDNIPVFSRSNVVNGRFNYQSADNKSIYTSALVSYDDPDNHFETEVEAVFEREQILRWGADRQIDISAIGCTSRGEAQRKGKYTLITNMFNRTVSFQTGLQGLSDEVLPGKLINVVDPLIGGRAYTGRIVAKTGQVITLDRSVDGKAGDLLYLTKSNGLTESRTIQSVSGNIVQVTTPYSEEIPAGSVWYLEASDLKSQLFRITKITSPSESVYEIEGVEYNASKYGAIDNGARLEPRPISVVPSNAQKAPENVKVSSYTYVEQTLAVSNLVINWDQTPNAVQYEVQWKVGDGDWINSGLTGANHVEVKGIYNGNYVARVRAINAIGIRSVWSNSQGTQLNGKEGAPPTLASLTTTGLLFGIRLDWQFKPGSSDTLYTQIRYSEQPTFETSRLLGDYAYPTDSHELHGLKADQRFYFWARLQDRSGNYGDWFPLTGNIGIVGNSLANDNGQYNDYFAGLIGNTALDKELYDRVELIDGPDTLPGSVNNRLKPIVERVETVNDRVTEANNRIDQINTDTNTAIGNLTTEINNKIDQVQTEAQTGISSANDRITQVNTEVNARIDQINSDIGEIAGISDRLDGIDVDITNANNKIDQINTDLGNRIDGTNNKIDQAVTNLEGQIANFKDALVYDPTKTYVVNDIVRVNNKLYQALRSVPLNTTPPNTTYWKDVGTSLVEANALALQVNTNTTNIGILDGKTTATANRLDVIQAAYREDDGLGDMDDALNDWKSLAQIAEERTVRANEDEALAQRIFTIQARVGENESKLTTVETAFANAEKASAEANRSLQASMIDTNAQLTSSQLVLAELGKATAESIEGLRAGVGDNKSAIESLQKVVVDGNSASASELENLKVQVNSNTSSISNLSEVVVDNNTATSTLIETLRSDVNGNSSKITSLTETVATNNSAVNQRVDTLTGVVNGNTSTITNLQKTVTDNQSATATRFQAVETKVADNTSAITDLSETVTTGNEATAVRLQTIETNVGNNTSSITDLSKTVTDTNTANATRFQTIESGVAGNKANITSLSETVATNQSASATRFESIETNVAGNKSSITNLSKTVTDNQTANTTRFQGIESNVASNTSKVNDLTETVATNESASATRFQTIETNVGKNTSSISTLTETVTTNNTATNSRIDTLTGRVGNSETNITNLTKTVNDNNTAITSRVGVLEGKVGTNTASIAVIQETITNNESATATQIQQIKSDVAGNTANITNLSKTVTDNNTATTEALSTIRTDVAGNTSTITNLAKTVSDNQASNATLLTGLRTDVNGNKSSIQTLSETQSTQNTATNSRIDSLTTEVGTNKSNITNLQKTVTDNASSTATEITSVNSRVDKEITDRTNAVAAEKSAREAAVSSEATTRADADGALGRRIDTTEASIADNEAFIQRVEEAQVTLENVVAGITTTVEAVYSLNRDDDGVGQQDDAINDWKNVAYYSDEVKVRANEDEALAQRITTLGVDFNAETARLDGVIQEERTVRATNDGVLAQRIDLTIANAETQNAALQASILSEATARANADEAISNRVEQTNASIATETSNREAAIRSEEQARASADEVAANRIDQLSASVETEVGRLSTAITTEEQARISGDSAIANRVDTLEAGLITDAQVRALVQTETDARVAADSALASQSSQIQAEVDNQSTIITQVSQATAGLDNAQRASWQVKMELNDQNQYVAAGIGLGIENGPAGLQSQFLVRADRFAVVNGVNGTTAAPFVVSGGQVFINEALIAKATITNAIIGSVLTSSAMTNWGPPVVELNMNAGQINTYNATRANTYTAHNANGIQVVVDGVLRVRMGTW